MYKITFENNPITWHGGNPENSQWANIPNEPIKQLKYTYKNRTIILEGYNEYCHIIKKGNALIGNFSGIMKVILMARTKKESQLFIWNLLKGEFYTATTEIDKEYNGKKVIGWKKGLLNKEPTFKII